MPLLREGEAIGVIVLARQRVEPFTDRQIELVSTFADQAVIAIENTRLITEQREALEQQTATAEVLQVINASPGNLAPVFDAMLEKAHAAVRGGVSARLRPTTASVSRAVATRGLPASIRGRYAARSLRPRSARSRRLIAAASASSTSPISAAIDATPAIADSRVHSSNCRRAHVRCLCRCARTERCSATSLLYRQEVRPFSDKQIALLENFAAQAVIAMENARLLTEQREALEQQTATAEVLQVINASPGNLAPVFDAMLEKAMRLCDAAFGTLCTYDGERFHVAGACAAYPRRYAEF